MKKKKLSTILTIGAALMILYGTFTLIKMQSDIADASAGVDTLKEQIQWQQIQNEELRANISNADSEQSIKSAARAELGMIESGEQIYIDVSN